MKKRSKFKPCEAVVFAPKWWHSFFGQNKKKAAKHPLKYGELVYFLGEIPNVMGHCLVAKYSGKVVAMIHPEDLRKAKESEL